MTSQDRALDAFRGWYDKLKLYGGFPAKGTISGGLVLLEHLKTDFDLGIDAHTAKGGSQVKGASGTSVRRILEQFGETRPFVAEGGRTNRGLRGDMSSMLDTLAGLGLESEDVEARNTVIMAFQGLLVSKVKEFHERQRLKVSYNPMLSAWQFVRDLLAKAQETGKYGPVAQYLVGAKLHLRFSQLNIGNESYSTADQQLGRQGDFLVGNTAFHVTVAPMPSVYEKCKRNIEAGIRPFLLIPYDSVVGARQIAEATAVGQIGVEAIESFVSQNIEELSEFTRDRLTLGLFNLLDTYNERVDAIEIDKSMLIEIPPNLAAAGGE